MALLTLDGLHLSFGGVAALAGVSLEIAANEFFAAIAGRGGRRRRLSMWPAAARCARGARGQLGWRSSRWMGCT